MTASRRRELLNATDLGRATLEQEDGTIRARGNVPEGTALSDADRTRLLGASSLGQAILRDEAKAANH